MNIVTLLVYMNTSLIKDRLFLKYVDFFKRFVSIYRHLKCSNHIGLYKCTLVLSRQKLEG